MSERGRERERKENNCTLIKYDVVVGWAQLRMIEKLV